MAMIPGPDEIPSKKIGLQMLVTSVFVRFEKALYRQSINRPNG